MPKYSIVTPMYNSFDLMKNYFASLNRQSFKDFEMIIVDDCSTDDSYRQLADYARKSTLNIKICQTEKNAGPGNARNIGMDHATGEWLTFIDNDDWVCDDFFERIDSIVCTYDINCVIYDYYIQRENERTVAKSIYKADGGNVTIEQCLINVRNHTLGKFYNLEKCRKSNIRFPNLRRCEDVAFVARAIEACGKAYYLNEPMYYYFQRSNSLSNNHKLDETDMIQAFAILEAELGNKYPKEIKEKSVTDLLYGVLLMMCKAEKSNKEIKEYIHKYEAKYPQWQKCEIIACLGIAKKVFLLAARFKMVSIMKLLARVHSKMVR